MTQKPRPLFDHLDTTIAVTALSWTVVVFAVQLALHLQSCSAPVPAPPAGSAKLPMQRRPPSDRHAKAIESRGRRQISRPTVTPKHRER